MSHYQPSHSNQSPPIATHSKSRKLLVAGIALILSVAVFAALFSWRLHRMTGEPPPQRPPVAVSALQIVPVEVGSSIRAVGSLRVVNEVMLSTETAGRVVSIHFEEGQVVEAGSLLVQLYDASERADRTAALAQAELAEAHLRRSKKLIGSGAESREALDERTAARDQARAAVKQWDARIEQKQVRAPFFGQLGIRQINLGQYLEPGNAIASLTDASHLYVDFSVPQQQLRLLQSGSTVRITSDVWPGREFTATVNTVEPRVNRDTRNVNVRALLPNPDNALQPGLFVNAELVLPAQPNQLVVPSTAIQTTAAGDSVLVIRGPDPTHEGHAEYMRVKVSRRLENQVVVSEGLEAGDVVVIEGQLKVPPGSPVRVANIPSEKESE